METVTLNSFSNYFQANICLAKLQSAGIECYLMDEYTTTINPVWTGAIGGIKVIVKKEDAERAITLIKQSEEEYIRSAKCPKCGAKDFTYISKPKVKNILSVILALVLVTYAPDPDFVYRCRHCGYETEILPDTSFEE
jgi:hypothetical protein